MLRDRVVCGINEATIQCRLLVEAHLTFQKAIKLAQGMESAAQNSRELQQGGPSGHIRSESSGHQRQEAILFAM